jgi:uncharacterized protein YprB with RNaseH-like and TPR domain
LMSDFRKALDRLRDADVSRGAGTESPDTTIARQLKWLREPSRAAPGPHLRWVPDEGLPSGTVVDTELGSFLSVSCAYPMDHAHGRVRLDRVSSRELSVLLDLAGCEYRVSDPERIVFLDTETTGVHGGVGICPFMIGLGFFDGDGFEVVQYFIRDFDEEPSMLLALGDLLQRFELIVTYNGRAFDLPLVENRCVISRLERPFEHMKHLDLLFMARRLWRAGHGSCKLTALEERLLRFARGPDIPGFRIPQAYFNYVQYGNAGELRAIFSHNVFDILSLCALTIFAADHVTTEPAPLDEPLDAYSLGRLFDRSRDPEKSIHCYELALRSPLPPGYRKRALERLSILYRREGDYGRSLERCLEIIAGSDFSLVAYEGASICHERHGGDLGKAFRILEEGIERIRGSSGMERRQARLETRRDRLSRRIERSRTGPSSLARSSPRCPRSETTLPPEA